MSMNLYLEVRQGRLKDQYHLLQTPTVLTMKVMNLSTMEARVDEYCKWVMSIWPNSDGKEHCEKLRTWVNEVRSEGLLPVWGYI